jgi:carbon storage regulator CsrA
MLVLSRRVHERVVFPDLEITVQVLEIKGDRVRLGFEAPAAVAILRGELAKDAGRIERKTSISPPSPADSSYSLVSLR